jgi:lysylphosphatidylglycerol synthetase-like protein (DUF2156 family)
MMFKEKRIFILDGAGALLSAFLLGMVLTSFEDLFGVPQKMLIPLSMIACAFAGYSFYCYALLRGNWRPYLKGIAFANLAYCILTLVLAISLGNSITPMGWIYFSGEITLVITLVFFELQIAFAGTHARNK